MFEEERKEEVVSFWDGGCSGRWRRRRSVSGALVGFSPCYLVGREEYVVFRVLGFGSVDGLVVWIERCVNWKGGHIYLQRRD